MKRLLPVVSESIRSAFQNSVMKTLLISIILIVNLSINCYSQSVLDPDDPVTEYDASKTYKQPEYGKIGKWVRTSRHWLWNTDSYKAYIYKGVAFRLKFPKSYNPALKDGKRYPMIVVFHGYGEVGPITDNEYQLKNGGQIHRDAVDLGVFDGYVMFMQCKDYWHDYHATYATEIINYMVAHNKLDPYRVSVHGLSGGAWHTWKTIIRYPQFFASALPMSGISMYIKDSADQFKFTPVWYFQGSGDTHPDSATAHAVRDKLLAAGANFKYTEFFFTQHDTWDYAYIQPDFFPFMNRAYASNPWALYGQTSFSKYPIKVVIGVAPGFSAYEWRKDGKIISNATSNKITVTRAGTYEARVLRGKKWSDWSPVPVVIKVGSTLSSTTPIASTEASSEEIPEQHKEVPYAYPNPFSDYFFLHLPKVKGDKVIVEIYDMEGRKLYSQQYSGLPQDNKLRVDVKGGTLSKGIYSLRIAYSNGESISLAIMKL